MKTTPAQPAQTPSDTPPPPTLEALLAERSMLRAEANRLWAIARHAKGDTFWEYLKKLREACDRLHAVRIAIERERGEK